MGAKLSSDIDIYHTKIVKCKVELSKKITKYFLKGGGRCTNELITIVTYSFDNY